MLPSVLWCCWLGGRKGIWPVKTEWWGVGVVICLERGADLQMAQLMSLPLSVSCFSKIQIGFTFLVPAHLGSPGKGPLYWCVCVSFGSRVLLMTLSYVGNCMMSCFTAVCAKNLGYLVSDSYYSKQKNFFQAHFYLICNKHFLYSCFNYCNLHFSWQFLSPVCM